MIAKDCELTLITVNGQGNWCHLALALNGVMIPHQKNLSVTTDSAGYDVVSVDFILAPPYPLNSDAMKEIQRPLKSE